MTKAENLDSWINEYSYKMVKELKDGKVNLGEIDKALGVLCNDGVYGYYVYCKSKSNGKSDEKIKSPMFSQFISNIVKEFDDIVYSGRELKSFKSLYEYDGYFSNLSTDIHKLLFFKDILEKILTYARYHAKAEGDINE
ncbi:MAG: hypothetical protein GX023_02930 [Tissierellia bacterium]|nr:hypothetical protein [Tissierellia bacterium]